MLYVELLDSGLGLLGRDGDGRQADTGLVVLDIPACDVPEIYVLVHFPESGRSLGQHYDLSGQSAPERARNLAIAIAELVDGTLGLPAPQAVAPAPAPEPAPDVTRAGVFAPLDVSLQPMRRPAWSVRVLAGVQAYPTTTGQLYGLQVGGLLRPSRSVPLRIALDASYRFDQDTSALGTISVRSAAGELALLYSGEAGRRSTGTGFGVGWDLGLRIALGWAWVRGVPSDQDSVIGNEGGAFVAIAWVQGAFRMCLAGSTWLVLDLQAGYVLSGFEVQAGDDLTGGQSRLALGLGIGLELEL